MFFYSEQDEAVQPVFPDIVTDGLHMYVDASLSTSYTSGQATWNDLSGNGRNGTIVGGVTYSADAGGTLQFDGTSGHVNFGDTPFHFTQPYFSFGLWFYWDNISKSATLIGDRQPTGWYANKTISILNDMYGNPGKKIWVFVRADSGEAFGGIIQDMPSQTGYYQIMVAISNNSQKVYLNGTPISTGNVNFTGKQFKTVGYPMLVGASTGNSAVDSFFDNKIGSVFYYNRTLSDAEITQNFNATKTRFGL